MVAKGRRRNRVRPSVLVLSQLEFLEVALGGLGGLGNLGVSGPLLGKQPLEAQNMSYIQWWSCRQGADCHTSYSAIRNPTKDIPLFSSIFYYEGDVAETSISIR